MKQSFFVATITGFVLMISFQNCSQGNFESSSSSSASDLTNKAITDDTIQNLLTRGRAEICPAIMCAAPQEGCHYEQDDKATNVGNQSKCLSSCGKLVCDPQPPKAEVLPKEAIICPMIACSAAPAGCQRVAAATSVKDTNGCDLNCGEIKCENDVQEIAIGQKPRICPMVLCAAPPEGCFYRPTTAIAGSNECPGCGELICKKPPFGTDLPPVPVE